MMNKQEEREFYTKKIEEGLYFDWKTFKTINVGDVVPFKLAVYVSEKNYKVVDGMLTVKNKYTTTHIVHGWTVGDICGQFVFKADDDTIKKYEIGGMYAVDFSTDNEIIAIPTEDQMERVIGLYKKCKGLDYIRYIKSHWSDEDFYVDE